MKFCAGFGSRGIFNFGELGPTERVAADADRARDRARARQIGAASIAIGLAAGVIAAALPIYQPPKGIRAPIERSAPRAPHPLDSPVMSRGAP